MQRGPTGQKVVISTVGEPCHAFVPGPLPPAPPLEWTPELNAQMAAAHVALGRLDGVR